MRPRFKGIFPTEEGKGHESKSSGAGGLKKIDVNDSTTQRGRGLAVSIQTMNFKDEVTDRYTKNTKRIDGELRAEAQDGHTRQPYAALVAYLYLPEDAATGGDPGPASLKHNAEVLASRSGRDSPKDDPSLFELAFVGLSANDGRTIFVRPEDVPSRGLPRDPTPLTFSQTLDLVRSLAAPRARTRS